MQANKGSGTKPEIALAKAMWAAGYRYRKNDKLVFGKPDFTYKRYRVAVFVDGEFWHGKDWDTYRHDFKSNQAFWLAKIERNRARDAEVNAQLQSEGWTVLRFWAKDVHKKTADCVAAVAAAIEATKLTSSKNTGSF